MASQVSPGVVIRERDLSNAVVVGNSAIRGAIASSFRSGPVGKIIYDSKLKRVYYLEGYVYAPGLKKRGLMQEISSILMTFEL